MSSFDSSDRYRLVESVYLRATDLPDNEREAFLRKACGPDEQLRAEVQSLIEHYETAPRGFLERPALDLGRLTATGEETDADAVRPVLPQRIGGYRIMRLLGRGGMGAVYEAEQPHPRRRVALKVIRMDALSDGAQRRFEQEAEVLGRLRHPGIAQIYEFGVGDVHFRDVPTHVQPFFAMELVEGLPLAEFVENRRLDRGEIVELVACVCDAVHHAHQKGVIHRDLKPRNILVEEDGQPKVLDFGIARVTRTPGQTITVHSTVDQLVGTIPYMSPEQIVDPQAIDIRSDVFALGVIAYQVLVGKPPLDVGQLTPTQAIRVLSEQDARPAGTIQPDLRGGDIEAILSKALRRNPDHRYGSAADFAGDLRRHLRREPIVARPPSRLYQFHCFAQRNRGLVVGAALAVMALMVGSVGMATFAWRESLQAGRAERQAVLAKEQAALAKEQAALATAQAARAEEQSRRAERQSQRAEEQAVRAQEESQRADATVRFLRKMLASADPQLARGADVTVRNVLDRAAERLDTEPLSDQPAVEAALRSTVGETYFNLGHVNESIPHLRTAVELLLETERPADAFLIETMSQYSEALDFAGQTAEAERIVRTALTLAREVYGNEHRKVATILNDLAVLLSGQLRFDEALSLHQEALALRRRLPDATSGDVAQSLNNMSNVVVHLGDLASGEALLRECIEIRRRDLAPDHPHLANSLNGLGVLLYQQQKYAQAEAVYEECLAIKKRIFEPDHPELALSMINYGAVLIETERSAEAVPLLERALEIRVAKFGTDSRQVAALRGHLGTALMKLGRYDDAEEQLRLGLAGLRALFGDRHPWVASALHKRGCLELARGRPDVAEPMLRGALRTIEQLERPGDCRSAGTHEALGRTLIQLGRYTEAVDHLEAARERYAATGGPDGPGAGVAAAGLSDALLRLGEIRQAEQVAANAIRILDAEGRERHERSLAIALLVRAEARIVLDREPTRSTAAPVAESAAIIQDAEKMADDDIHGIATFDVEDAIVRATEIFERCFGPDSAEAAAAARVRALFESRSDDLSQALDNSTGAR